MKLKSIKNRFKNRLIFLLGFGLVLDGFWVDFGGVFGTLDLQKWSCGVGEVLFFKKSPFFDLIWFVSDFLMILGGFREDFGSQNGAKMG